MLSRATFPVHINHFGILNELCQVAPGSSLEDTYTSVGMDHSGTWTCTLTVTDRGNSLSYVGVASTKKDAKNRCVMSLCTVCFELKWNSNLNSAAREACIALGLVSARE